jgi:hypothetical protein
MVTIADLLTGIFFTCLVGLAWLVQGLIVQRDREEL